LLQHCDLKVNGWATDKWNLWKWKLDDI
jgi:hypothetical protein